MANHDERAAEAWMGLSCPECHTLFRVPRETMGKRVECPHCREVVTVPIASRPEAHRLAPNQFRKAEDLVRDSDDRSAADPAAVPAGSAASGAGGSEGDGERIPEPRPAGVSPHRKKVRKKAEVVRSGTLDWDETGAPTRKQSVRGMTVLMIAVGAIVILLLGIAALVLRGNYGGEPRIAGGGKGVVLVDPPNTPSEAEAEIGGLEMGAVLSEIEETVEKFLQAESVEELLPLVRGDADLKRRIREFYERTELAPVAARDVAPNGKIMKSGTLWAVDVVLPNFSVRPIAVEFAEDGCRIDWESWVGHSEISWEQFQEKRPVEAKLFRVLCSPVEYYNFDFSDEKQWRSYRLVSPDRTQVLYGYVARYSILESMLAPCKRSGEKGFAFVLKLRYPENPSSRNQVLIEEVVESGWVLGGKRRKRNSNSTSGVAPERP